MKIFKGVGIFGQAQSQQLPGETLNNEAGEYFHGTVGHHQVDRGYKST